MTPFARRIAPAVLALLGGGLPAVAAAGVEPEGPAAGGGQDTVIVDEATETVIRGALKYLASKQQPNGAWGMADGEKHHVAMTGYTLMAFMAAGHLPEEGEYGKHVAAGGQFLLESVKGDGFIQSGNSNMYGHGIAAIALAELYGQTRDPRMRPKLQQVVRLILSCQNNQGGWRYAPRVGDADISVTVLQAVALRAALNSGLEVPQAAIDRAVAYVRSCYHNDSTGGFTYQPHNNSPGFARTAAAVYSLQVCGQYDDPHVKKGSAFLAKALPDMIKRQRDEWFTYGHFYAAPAQYMVGGETWKEWYTTLRDLLLKNVKRQGDTVYWEPQFDDGGHGQGPLYVTAVYTTILSMPYHYVPLYQR
jgi:hypothetical protein